MNPESLSETGDAVRSAASLIRSSRYLTAFTGAGISVESGIPPFRGEGGLWNKYDSRKLELDYFLKRPEVSWPILREIFYDHFGKARPNKAHEVLAAWERDGWPRGPGAGSGGTGGPEARGYLQVLITQNIDNLNHDAGSRSEACDLGLEGRGRLHLVFSGAARRAVSAATVLLCFLNHFRSITNVMNLFSKSCSW
jgi:hypothetical protein